jgi:hypothetical protein
LEIGAKTMVVVVETMMTKENRDNQWVIHHQIKMVPLDQGIRSLLRITPILILGVITKPPIMDPATIQLAINVVMSTTMTGTEVIKTQIQDLLGIVLHEVMIL